MSVSIGFMIAWMVLLLTYTFYRLVKKRSLLMTIPVCCQVFSLAIAVPGFINNVEPLPIIQAAYILLGILPSAGILASDYFKMIKKVKNQGTYEGLIEAPARKDTDTRCLPAEGINQLAKERQTNEVIKELQSLPEELQKNFRKILNHAQSLVSENKLGEVYAIYDTLSKVAASSCSLHYNRAGICYRLGRYEGAVDGYKKAMELVDQTSPEMFDLAYNMGNTYFMLKKYEKAAKSFEKAIEVNPADIQARENLAFTFVHMGEKDKGIDLLNRINEGESGYRAHFISGKLLYEAARYQEAVVELERCIQLQPSSTEARDELYRALMKQDKYEDALKIVDEILKAKPDEYVAWCGKASLCGKLNRWNDTVDCYRKAISLKPDSYKNYYNMAMALEECGDRKAAIEAYRKAIGIRTDFVDAYNNLGIALSLEGMHVEALEVYEEGIRTNPNDFSLFFNMGTNLFEAGRFVEAVAAYRNALDIKPEELEVYYYLGAALTELRHYNDAIEAYKCALKEKPSDGELHYNIAAIYAMLGRYDIAGENLKQAISLKDEIRNDVMKNKAFDGMRGRSDFRELVS